MLPDRRRGEVAAPLLLAALVFAVYAAGACRTVYVGDSGELVTAVYRLGIAHPTGYPLYVLLGKLWTLAVPVGSMAFRMSLFSAACAAAACGVLLALLRRAGTGAAAATFGALLLAASPSFWSQANIQRVYALNALFVLLATLAAWRFWEDRRVRSLALAFFLCGLGATNHVFMGVYALALGLFAVAVEPSLLRRPRALAAAGCALLLGLAPYAYLPLRSRADPVLDWGDPETLDHFLGVVLRRGFWERRWIEGPSDLLPIAADWAHSLGAELAWVGAALALVGLAFGRRRRWPVALPVLVMLGNLAAVAIHGSRSDIFLWHRYYIPSYAMGALLAGLGCQVAIEQLPRAARLLPLAIPLAMFAGGWRDADRSRHRVAEAYADEVLRELPPGAHLAASDDNILFSLIYLHFVERRRPDVDLILQGAGGELPPLHFDPEREPLYFTHHPNWSHPDLAVVPLGLVFRVVRRGSQAPAPTLPAALLACEDDPRVPKDDLTRDLIGYFHYMLGVTFEERDWLRARREFEAAERAAPENEVLFYNLGLIYQRNGLLDDALAAFERVHAINPRHLTSGTRPRASDRIAEVGAEQERLRRIKASLATASGLSAEPLDAEGRRRLADGFAASGEPVAARGQRLLALEAGSPDPAR